MTATYHSSDVIEGSFRVVSSTDIPQRSSPNRRRAVARILFWNLVTLAAVVALPILY